MFVLDHLLAKAERWEELKRWERRELGQALRQLGLAYREIREIIPAPQSTLSTWCKDLELPSHAKERIRAERARLIGRRGVGKRRREQRLREIEAIRLDGMIEGRELISDPSWMAGVVAYWSEGAKSDGRLRFANSDPEMVSLFISWARRYLDLDLGRFIIALHLHSGQDELERREFWSQVTGLPLDQFRKTYIKPEGTGHRKNVLYNGTASMRVTKSTDLLHRVAGWIEAVKATVPFR